MLASRLPVHESAFYFREFLLLRFSGDVFVSSDWVEVKDIFLVELKHFRSPRQRHNHSSAGKMTSLTAKTSLDAVHELLMGRLSGNAIRIYEAGGGSASFLRTDLLDRANVTVLDIDEVQLQKNSYADRKVLGDVQMYAFPENSFDLIVCYNVIEHLDAPDRAIDLFFRSLAPGGLLFIGAPNPNSFSGWVTKVTPHWFHVWYYRHVLKYKTAGQPGSMPFRTVYHPITSPNKLISYGLRLGFRAAYFEVYQGDLFRQLSEQRPALGTLLNAFVSVLNAATLWRKDLKKGDFHLVLEKPNALHPENGITGATSRSTP